MKKSFSRTAHSKILLNTLVASMCSVIATGCAIDPKTGQPSFKETFASEDPCSNNARNIGMGVGVLAGAVLGNQVSHSNQSRLLGAALGATIGGLIGHDMDSRRCELSKIAKKYNLDMQMSTVSAEGEVLADANLAASNNPSEIKKNAIGSVVEVRDLNSIDGHFESNSDKLTPKAQEYFSAIADTYNPNKAANQIQNPNERAAFLAQMSHRKILLVGHTDDTGSSKINADLSERRARAVSNFMQSRGIPKESLYYQGAGEFYPIADNSTEAGRAGNRRVEIIDLAGNENLEKYLIARKPKYQFYRQKVAEVAKAPSITSSPTQPKTINKNDSQIKSIAKNSSQIDFGGVPLTPSLAVNDMGKLETKKSLFSLISTAYADEPAVVSDCTRDHPRIANGVKSLTNGKVYRTSEYIPGLYGKTWTDRLNGHQIVINKISVLSSDGSLGNQPEFKIYTNYDPGKNRNPEPNVMLKPEVNTYLGSKGILYRMFINGRAGVQCADLVFDNEGGTVAKAGKLIYAHEGSMYIANFKPKMY